MSVKAIVLAVVLVLMGTCAYAADCNNGGRYEVMGDVTVQDCRTGLIWLQNANCTDTSNRIANPGGYLTWYDALTWVAGIGNGLCGLTDGSSAGDWRLPTKTEWMAMVAYANYMGYTSPALTNAAGTTKWLLNGYAFNNVQSNGYWSSTTYASNTTFAWGVSMQYGYVYSSDKANSFYVWPVRGGQSGEFGSLIIQ